MTNICQMDGNDSAQSGSHMNSSDNNSERADNSTLDYDSDEEVDSEPVRAVLVPGSSLQGQPPSLEVADSSSVQAPSNLPLTMVANFRSAYNKVDNIKKILNTIGLDLMVASESWERPGLPLDVLLDSPHFLTISYCRGREAPAIRQDGKHAGKQYPGKTGGGAAIIYNKHRFEATDTQIGVPAGVEVVRNPVRSSLRSGFGKPCNHRFFQNAFHSPKLANCREASFHSGPCNHVLFPNI